MNFRNKILLSIGSVVLSLLIITYFIINYWTRSKIEDTFTDELRTNLSTIEVLDRLQTEILIRSCLVIAESPRLRAVAELGDPGTAYELSKELSATTLSRLFVLTDKNGNPLAQILEGSNAQMEIQDREAVRKALQNIATTDVWAFRDNAYRTVTVPILLDKELFGTLTIGFRITKEDIATLKQATNSDITLILEDSILTSTLDSLTTRALLPAIAAFDARASTVHRDTSSDVFDVLAAHETYLGTIFHLSKNTNSSMRRVSYLIMKPLSREVRQSMSSIFGTFGLVSLIFLVLTTIIGIVISGGITRPITDLVAGTQEVSKGNYDYRIPIRGDDEISFLSRKFMAMSESLKEKISQLDQLNRDLLRRNADLDETLQKLKEAQQELVRNERLAATGKMTAQLAHEINNPIHNIQSCLNTALNRIPPESKGRELVEVAFEEVGRMSRLTNQLLNVYRASHVEVAFQPVQIADTLREVTAMMEEELASAHISIRADIDSGLPPVKGSKDKLKQVLLNIILNARDAMPAGGAITIAAGPVNGSVKIAISDTGVGIPKENLNRVFDAFFTTKDKVSGVGLGLSVSYGIISQHNGTITVSSTPGKGSTFTISIPSEVQHTS